MGELVTLGKNEPVTTTLIIADGMNVKHHAILVLVKKYEKLFKNSGTLEFEIQKSGGRPTTFYYLNEEQTSFLITLMRNSDVVVNFKLQLVKGFYEMKSILADMTLRQKNEAWKLQREQGKLSRKEETDIIQKFVEYATKQGSQSARRYYENISKMENKALFFLQERFKNVRNALTGQQLQIIATADIAVAEALKIGMEESLPYKEIYQLAKQRVELIASVIPKTTVPMLESKKLIT